MARGAFASPHKGHRMERTVMIALALAALTPASMLACSGGGDEGTAAASANTDPKTDADGSTRAPDDDGGDTGPVDGDAGTEPDVDADVDPGPPAFTTAEAQTLFDSRCAPCHVGGQSAGMSLANDFTVATVGVASTELPSMNRIEPGDREKSYLFHKIRGTHLQVGGSGARMPLSGPPYLSDEEIERIGKYIDGL
jgi:mono/diheme cytochrome c family protein